MPESKKSSVFDAEYLELAKNPEKNEARPRELVAEALVDAGESFSHTDLNSITSSANDEVLLGRNKGIAYGIKTQYNEYNTNLMQWAYSSTTKPGDVKIFNKNGKNFTLIEATEDGYIELASGNYSNLKKERDYYDTSRGEYDRWVKTTRSGQRDNNWNNEFSQGQPGKIKRNGKFLDRKLGKSSDRTGNSQKISGDSGTVKLSDRDAEYLELAKNPEKNEERLKNWLMLQQGKKDMYFIIIFHQKFIIKMKIFDIRLTAKDMILRLLTNIPRNNIMILDGLL